MSKLITLLINYQAIIRKYLLMTLDDSHRKICTAVSMAVASIAVYDWPEDWPELLPNLMKLINDQTNMKRGRVFHFLTIIIFT